MAVGSKAALTSASIALLLLTPMNSEFGCGPLESTRRQRASGSGTSAGDNELQDALNTFRELHGDDDQSTRGRVEFQRRRRGVDERRRWRRGLEASRSMGAEESCSSPLLAKTADRPPIRPSCRGRLFANNRRIPRRRCANDLSEGLGLRVRV